MLEPRLQLWNSLFYEFTPIWLHNIQLPLARQLLANGTAEKSGYYIRKQSEKRSGNIFAKFLEMSAERIRDWAAAFSRRNNLVKPENWARNVEEGKDLFIQKLPNKLVLYTKFWKVLRNKFPHFIKIGFLYFTMKFWWHLLIIISHFIRNRQTCSPSYNCDFANMLILPNT